MNNIHDTKKLIVAELCVTSCMHHEFALKLSTTNLFAQLAHTRSRSWSTNPQWYIEKVSNSGAITQCFGHLYYSECQNLFNMCSAVQVSCWGGPLWRRYNIYSRRPCRRTEEMQRRQELLGLQYFGLRQGGDSWKSCTWTLTPQTLRRHLYQAK